LSHAKGVKKAEVTLDKAEAKVTYDPKQTDPKKLVDVVKNAKGMATYSATVKK